MRKNPLLPLLVLCAAASSSVADELVFDAARLAQQAVVSKVRLAPDKKTFELESGELIEDDGPAAGFSYRPNEEKLSEGVWIKKELMLPEPKENLDGETRLARGATLLIGSKAEFHTTINGQVPTWTARGSAGNYWSTFSFDPKILRYGTNEIVLRGAGNIWIARDDEFATGSQLRRRHPNRSARSIDQGQTWNYDRLGTKGEVDGEYYVRLFLDRYQLAGYVQLPVVDLGNLTEQIVAPAIASLPKVSVNVESVLGPDSKLTIWAQTGLDWSQKASPKQWFDWQEFHDHKFVIEKPRGRFLHLRINLSTTDPLATPRLRQVAIRTEPKVTSGWEKQLRVVEQQNAEIVRSSIPFEYERCDRPQLQKLRQEQRLETVVAGAKDEFDMICRLANWSASRWKSGHLKDIYPAWNANEILRLHADGTPIGGFCQQYNLVFLQACQSFGLVGRAVSLGSGDHGMKIRSGHEVVEIWSNQFNKWVYVDGQAAWYFVDAKSRTPLSLRELRTRQLDTFANLKTPPVEVVRLSENSNEWSGLEAWPPFAELRLIPRSDFLVNRSPLPLNQGMRGWFWTGHQVWSDERYPASLLYGERVTNARDWDWTLNQTHWRLEATTKPGELRVQLDTDTPSCKTFEISKNGSPFEAVYRTFTWTFSKADELLEMRAKNVAGRSGPSSRVRLEYAARGH